MTRFKLAGKIILDLKDSYFVIGTAHISQMLSIDLADKNINPADVYDLYENDYPPSHGHQHQLWFVGTSGQRDSYCLDGISYSQAEAKELFDLMQECVAKAKQRVIFDQILSANPLASAQEIWTKTQEVYELLVSKNLD